MKTKNTFDQYVIPKIRITEEAERITGIHVEKAEDGETVVMSLQGCTVEAASLTNCIRDFIVWLEDKQRVVLIAHNCRKFDARILMAGIHAVDMYDQFIDKVWNFSDTFTLFKQIIPKQKSYALVNLVRVFLMKTYSAHDAGSDADILCELLIKLKVNSGQVMKHSFKPHIYNSMLL